MIMKATLRYPKSTALARPANTRPQPDMGEDDRMTQIAFYFFAGLMVVALLYFIVLTFVL